MLGAEYRRSDLSRMKSNIVIGRVSSLSNCRPRAEYLQSLQRIADVRPVLMTRKTAHQPCLLPERAGQR